ncbi:MAG: alpha/beta fold hydrolase [Romboutsia sp.]|uniref:alpha/beta fold hydrolase n=1 Tax=Romboutsia sp. TaxID=1965302 RepID=UPI003F3148BE
MEIIQGMANNDAIKIHYIENQIKDSKKVPLLICPGLSESAKDYLNIIESINDRRCIAMSFRGRGKSDSPQNGYTLEDHIKDITSVVEELYLNQFCIMGYSRGVSYALGYSILNNNLLKGLILGEYPAEHKKMPRGWAKESMEFYKTHCDSISIEYEVLKSIEEESKQVNFKEQLSNITCKTLILKGETEETLLTMEDISDYLNNLNSKYIKVKRFEKAGHDIKEDDFENLIEVLKEFLDAVDN